MKPSKISHIVIMGDSLSDRGTMNNRRLFGFIPMSRLAGLQGTSPDGRFTNGFAWDDDLSMMIADGFIKNELKEKRKFDVTDISDAVINQDIHCNKILRNSYQLNSDRTVDYKGQNLIRNFNEGGLTAHDYGWTLSKSISRFFSRIILSTLTEMRQRLLADDDARELSNKHKRETVIVEWSGANDLITVNERPSYIEVDKVIQARVENVKLLLKKGYRHFILFNLPDLSLIPRFQSKSEADRTEASMCSLYLNDELKKACQELSDQYCHCSIEVFDVNHTFSDVYQHPEQYKFEQSKLKTPYTTSPDFTLTPEHTSPAKGYMFYDDVHPTADMHALLAEVFYLKYREEYHFAPPVLEPQYREVLNISKNELLTSFQTLYSKVLTHDQRGFFGRFKRSHLDYKTASLEDILTHALYGGGQRTLSVMKELQWLDEKGNLNLNIPALGVALKAVEYRHDRESESAALRA